MRRAVYENGSVSVGGAFGSDRISRIDGVSTFGFPNFAAIDTYGRWRFNAKFDFITTDLDNRDRDLIINDDRFVLLTG
jgi:hypothetical protein